MGETNERPASPGESSQATTAQDDFESAFHAACARGDIDAAKQFLYKGVNEDARDSDGRTAMHKATHNRHVEMVRMLGFQHDAFAYWEDNSGTTPMMIAVKNNHPQMVALLSSLDGRPGIKDKQGWTALHYAANDGNLPILRMLNSHPKKFIISNKDGDTPLDLAARAGHTEAVEFILERRKKKKNNKDFDLTIPNLEGRTALSSAVASGSMDSTKLLYEAEPRALDISDKKGHAPVTLAACRGDLELVKFLVDNGADIHIADNIGDTPLAKASKRGHVEIAEYLSEHDKNEANKPKKEPRQAPSIMKKLFGRG